MFRDRKKTVYQSPILSCSNYSFVANLAKRKFLTPQHQPKHVFYDSGRAQSKSNILYDALSYISSDHSGDISDSSPTSGYSSCDLLDSDCDRSVTGGDTRSKSVPIISRNTNTQDYTTGIKPASHRLENHSSTCSVQSSMSARDDRTGNIGDRENRAVNTKRKQSNLNKKQQVFVQQNVQICNASIPRYFFAFYA